MKLNEKPNEAETLACRHCRGHRPIPRVRCDSLDVWGGHLIYWRYLSGHELFVMYALASSAATLTEILLANGEADRRSGSNWFRRNFELA
jgi:hypothetical protein